MRKVYRTHSAHTPAVFFSVEDCRRESSRRANHGSIFLFVPHPTGVFTLFCLAVSLAHAQRTLCRPRIAASARPRTSQTIFPDSRRVRNQLRPPARTLPSLESLVVDAHVRCGF